MKTKKDCKSKEKINLENYLTKKKVRNENMEETYQSMSEEDTQQL